jgi:hypothetical protein
VAKELIYLGKGAGKSLRRFLAAVFQVHSGAKGINKAGPRLEHVVVTIPTSDCGDVPELHAKIAGSHPIRSVEKQGRLVAFNCLDSSPKLGQTIPEIDPNL